MDDAKSFTTGLEKVAVRRFLREATFIFFYIDAKGCLPHF